jgi:hypothetical protein
MRRAPTHGPNESRSASAFSEKSGLGMLAVSPSVDDPAADIRPWIELCVRGDTTTGFAPPPARFPRRPPKGCGWLNVPR